MKKLRGVLGKAGLLVIIDFKKEKPPPGPPMNSLAPEQAVESELKSAGFAVAQHGPRFVANQYIIKAK